MPDPWLLDSEQLLTELARVRQLALRIPPARNDIVGTNNSLIHASLDLAQRLRFCLHLHCDAQRAFRTAAVQSSHKRQGKSLDRHAVARPANARPRALAKLQ